MALRKKFVEIKHLSYAYAHEKRTDEHVLKDFSLQITQGQLVSIMGPSGCGKSTLASLLAGYLMPARGSIVIDGNAKVAPSKHCIVINQANDIFEWLTVWDNMKLGGANDEAIVHYLKLVGLYDMRHRRGLELSGGMKKRLSFARALSVNSKFIILDEAFASLDYTLRHNLYEETLTIVRAEKMTALIITHDIEEAVYLSDRIVILSPSPATIRADIDVTSLREEAGTEFHHSPLFYNLIDNVKKELVG